MQDNRQQNQDRDKILADAANPMSFRPIGTVIRTVVAYLFVFWLLLPSFLLFTGLRLDYLRPVGVPQTSPVIFVAWIFILAGLAVLTASIGQLWRKGKGLPISHLPPSQFVAQGLYRYLRHPIYVGYTIAFAGLALVIHSFWSLVFSAPLLIAGWVAYVLYFEEPVLIERFGDSYRDYRRCVHILWPFPRLSPKPEKPIRFLLRTYTWLNCLANQTILFRRGSFILVTYGLFCSIGGLLFAQSNSILLTQQGLSRVQISLFLLGATVSTSLFAWLFWWLNRIRTMINQPLWGINRIGFVSYGGLMGIVLFALVFAAGYGYHPFMLTDILMQGIFLAYAIGRIGCLTFGCCYGMPTQRAWGIVYTNPEAKVRRLGDRRNIPRHPTQLYSFVHAVVMVVLVNVAVSVTIPVGLATAIGFMFVGIGRTFTESYRDRKRPLLGRFTYGHVGGWLTFLCGWVLLFLVVPDSDAYTPQLWSLSALNESLPLIPVVVLCAVFVLAVFGVHWKQVGTWGGANIDNTLNS